MTRPRRNIVCFFAIPTTSHDPFLRAPEAVSTFQHGTSSSPRNTAFNRDSFAGRKGSLVICTRVCREWQVAFEPLIYPRQIYVISADGVSKDDGERSMSLSHFQNVTTGKELVRRVLIQHLSYHIVVPIDLPDWQTRKRKGYKLENNIRHENDLAFQSAILDLFETLNS